MRRSRSPSRGRSPLTIHKLGNDIWVVVLTAPTPTTSDAIQWLSHYAGTTGWKDDTLVWSYLDDWNRFEDVGGDWADIMSETKYAGA